LSAGQHALFVLGQAPEGVMLGVEVRVQRVEQAKVGGVKAVLIPVMGRGLNLSGQGQELLMRQQGRIPRAHRTAGITIV